MRIATMHDREAGYTLLLVRHAIAAERGEQWPDDAKRPLTDRGARRFERAVQGLRSLDLEIEEILTSPLVRAKQTAHLLAAGLGGKTPVRRLPALAPGGSPGGVVDELRRTAQHRRLALVGHEPGLGELAAHLIGVDRPLAFRKGGVCRIDVGTFDTAPHGSLIWFMPPRVLRALKA